MSVFLRRLSAGGEGIPLQRLVGNIVATGIGIGWFALCVYAVLQPYNQHHETTRQEQPANNESPEIAPGLQGNRDTATQQPGPQEQSPNWITRIGLWLRTSGPAEWLLAFIGIGAAIAAFWTLCRISEQARETKKIAVANLKAANAAKRAVMLRQTRSS